MKSAIAALAIAGGLAVTPAGADDCPEKTTTFVGSPITGADCLKFNEVLASFYMHGLIHGLFVSTTLGAPLLCVETFAACAWNMQAPQTGRILLKYLRDNPERLHLACNHLAVNALAEACEKLSPGGWQARRRAP